MFHALSLKTAFIHEYEVSLLKYRIHLQVIHPTQLRFARLGGDGITLKGRQWQICRSLDDASALFRSFYGPSGLILSRLRTKRGVRRYRRRSEPVPGDHLTPLYLVLDVASALWPGGP